MKGLIPLTTAIFLVSVQASTIHLSPKGLLDRSVSDRRSPGTRARERLMKMLLDDYDKRVKPEPYDESPLQVSMSLSLLNLDSVVTKKMQEILELHGKIVHPVCFGGGQLDTKERIIETHSWVSMTWTDERLSWDPSDFHQVKMIHMPADFIWIPDIDLYNNDGDAEKPISDTIADVYSNGSVFYEPELHLKSLCETGQQATEAVRIARLLGFNELVCKLKFGSWTYDATEIKLATPSSQIDLSDFRRVSTDEFQVKSTSAEVDQETFKCCPNPYQIATFTIIITENSKYRYNTK